MSPHAIETHDLSKRYGDVTALAALDLRVPEHAIFGFLGPNGAGKSTAMKLLFGKEMAAWWRVKTWWVQLALFLGLVVALPAVAAAQLLGAGELEAGPAEARWRELRSSSSS